jgi:hypothetical protein
MAPVRRNRLSRSLIDNRIFRLADEVRDVHRRVAILDSRVVRVGPFLPSSTCTGDTWLLDPANGLAARLARGGTPEPVDIGRATRIDCPPDALIRQAPAPCRTPH